MATVEEFSELFDKVGGYICTFEVGERTDAVFCSFAGRLVAVDTEYEPETIQLHINQSSTSSLSYLLFHTAQCTIDIVNQRIRIADGAKRYAIRILPHVNNSRETFKNKLLVIDEPKKSKNKLECPYCGKECSSTSGLTLHKKGCKEKP